MPITMDSPPPNPAGNKDFTSYLRDLEQLCQTYFVEKAPALPAGVREFIVAIAPYLVILGVVLSAFGMLVLLGFGPLAGLAFWMGGGLYGFGLFVKTIAMIAIIILEVMAIQGLFHRKRQAWNFMFYAALIQSIENLLVFNIIGLVIGTAISLYFLFQVRSYYQ